ncbi:MAG: hypothetical protein ACPGGK_01720 [Pikeienuella sp.]
MKNTLNRYDLSAKRLCVAAVAFAMAACSGPDQLYQAGADSTAEFPRLVDKPNISAVEADATTLRTEMSAAAAAAAARRHKLAAFE